MIRRRRVPTRPWRGRVDEARRLIESHRPTAMVTARLDDIERALGAAADDLDRADAALETLQPDRVARELKDTLRDRQRRGESTEDEVTATLRRRYELTHSLQDRREELAARIELTLVHLDALAVRSVEASFRRDDPGSDLTRDLEALADDLEALEAAHAELEGR